ncbi:MATE family efflux transporter [Clostridium ganghwense]|uniref:Multidrug export protein MepA n=1 Tax=Clostridium ganghwense TaxID=312089 RepID=A0ABT4CRP2_9CLOT|nr:MATE family efflux transporter [Clostridium ganghwense]MCY6371735.1 MATE family efflux transporter [Clostridium ganghwense]
MDKTTRLREENIGSLLLKFFIPAIVGNVVNALYNIVDRIYIGRGVGDLALAALSIIFPIMIITSGFGMLMGIGGGVLQSLNLGKGDKDKAEKVLGNTFILLIIASIIVSILCFIIKTPLLKAFGASKNTIQFAEEYLSIILLGTIVQNLGFGLNNSIRSEGNANIAMITMIIGAVLNIILDPLFIFVFKMGIKGAAIATVISQTANTIWVIAHFRSTRSVLKLKKENFKLNIEIVKGIVAIGMAPFAIQAAGGAVNILLNKQLIRYSGDSAIGAMGVITSISMLIIMSIISITQAAQPIIGYNYGAKLYFRVKKTLKLAVIGATILGITADIIIQLFPEHIIGLFNKEPQLMQIGSVGLRITLCMLPIIGYQIIGGNYFQAIGKAKTSMILSMLRQVLVLIPLLIILPKYLGLIGVWIAAPISDIISFFITVFLFNKEVKKLDIYELDSSTLDNKIVA